MQQVEIQTLRTLLVSSSFTCPISNIHNLVETNCARRKPEYCLLLKIQRFEYVMHYLTEFVAASLRPDSVCNHVQRQHCSVSLVTNMTIS